MVAGAEPPVAEPRVSFSRASHSNHHASKRISLTGKRRPNGISDRHSPNDARPDRRKEGIECSTLHHLLAAAPSRVENIIVAALSCLSGLRINRFLEARGRTDGAAEHAILACYPSILMSIFQRSFASAACSLLLAILVGNTSVEAATTRAFRVRSEGTYTAERLGRILVDGTRWRIDYDPSDEVRTHDTLIGNRSDRRVAINHSNKTWFYLDADSPTVSVPTLFNFHRVNPTTASKLRVEFADTKTRSPAAAGNTRIIAFRYRTESKLGSESVRCDVSGQILLTMGSAVDNDEIRPLSIPQTGIADVDRKIAEKIAEITGPVYGSEITITRTFEGGSPMTQVIRETIEVPGLDAAAEPKPFEIPDGYQYQMPQLGVP